jgi:COMPASS component SWD3
VAHDARSGRRVVEPWLSGHAGLVTRLTYDVRSSALATASRDRSIKLWQVGQESSPICTGSLAGHELTVSAIHWAAGGRLLASGSRDSTVRVWDAEAQKAVLRVHRPQNLVTCLQWHPAMPQSVIVQSGEDLRVRLWDTRIGKEVHLLEGYTYFPVSRFARDGGLSHARASHI